MGGPLHANACGRLHGHLLVVILIVQVDDLDLVVIDPKRHPPVLRHEGESASRSEYKANSDQGWPVSFQRKAANLPADMGDKKY